MAALKKKNVCELEDTNVYMQMTNNKQTERKQSQARKLKVYSIIENFKL